MDDFSDLLPEKSMEREKWNFLVEKSDKHCSTQVMESLSPVMSHGTMCCVRVCDEKSTSVVLFPKTHCLSLIMRKISDPNGGIFYKIFDQHS